jgi:hypothetical protein
MAEEKDEQTDAESSWGKTYEQTEEMERAAGAPEAAAETGGRKKKA